MFCSDIPAPIYLIFSKTVPPLLYYSHIPVLIISILLGVFIFINNKSLISRILIVIIGAFSFWTLFSLITWTNISTTVISFVWSFFGLLSVILFLGAIYFTEVYITQKDVGIKTKLIWLILLLPQIIFIKQAAANFNLTDCEVIVNPYYDNYGYAIGLLAFLWILIFSIVKYFKTKEKKEKKQIVYLTSGISAFLVSFFVAGFFATYLDNYNLEFFGLFGMVVFMGYLTFLIVRFKAFDIKLIGARALVWSLIILIGSEFFFVTSLMNQFLVGLTLAIAVILGLRLVGSVRKEVTLREQLEKANAGQKNLIHIMNHQIKGYLGISKNIFAELLTDDYGKMPEEAKDIVTQGLENADNGVKYVTTVLRGDSAENGSLVFDMKIFDFKNLVSEVMVKEKDLADKKGLKLNFDSNQGDYNILGDSSQLGEAVRNLIDNSIFYTPSGSVSVKLSIQDNKVLLKVTDTGVGIKEEDKPKLFKAGGVSADSIKINANSSGYGLAFVKGVIEKHNGRVWFESDGAGKGSVFYIELPMK